MLGWLLLPWTRSSRLPPGDATPSTMPMANKGKPLSTEGLAELSTEMNKATRESTMAQGHDAASLFQMVDKNKDGKLVSSTVWKPNGEKCTVSNLVNRNGVVVLYEEDGSESERLTIKEGEIAND